MFLRLPLAMLSIIFHRSTTEISTTEDEGLGFGRELPDHRAAMGGRLPRGTCVLRDDARTGHGALQIGPEGADCQGAR